MPSNSTKTSGLSRGRIGWLMLAGFVFASGFYFAGRSGSDPSRYSNDFNVYYHAAREVMAGRDPYQNSLGAWTPYLYPPLLSELLIPIAVLPLWAASYLWFLVNAVSLFLAARLAARLLIPKRSSGPKVEREANSRISSQRAAVAIGALIIVFRFALDSFALGQVNPLLASLVIAHVYLFDRKRRLASAIALVLAASIKLSPLLLIGYHAARRRFKFAMLSVLLFLLINALSFGVLGRHASTGFEAFWNRTIRNRQGYDLAYAGNQSLRGAIARMEGRVADGDRSNQPFSAATVVGSILLLIIAGIAAWRAGDEATAAAPFACLVVLLSPLAWKAHFVGMVLAAAVVVNESIAVARSGNGGAASSWKPRLASHAVGVALVLVFSLWNLTSPNVIGLAAAEWADSHSLVFVAGLLLFLATTFSAFGAIASTSIPKR
jgi:alpha-1,2-mannosyltransferase